MAVSSLLGTGLTVLTNPNPNTLSVVPPYPDYIAVGNPPYCPSSAWTNQGSYAVFPCLVKTGDKNRIVLDFVPSGGVGVSYTIITWFFNPVAQVWVTPANSAIMTYTGPVRDYIDNPGGDAIFLQIDSLSAGSLAIYLSSDTAQRG